MDESVVLQRSTRSGRVRRANAIYARPGFDTDINEAAAYAFAAALRAPDPPYLKRLHRDSLPEPPNHWKDIKGHQFKAEWLEAAQYELNELELRGTWVPSSHRLI
jgi:hypothetical protein